VTNAALSLEVVTDAILILFMAWNFKDANIRWPLWCDVHTMVDV